MIPTLEQKLAWLKPVPAPAGDGASTRTLGLGEFEIGFQRTNDILDEGLIGHVAFVVEGQPYAIPVLYARDGDVLYLHGSPLSRLLSGLAEGVPMCFTVTLVDGLVLARSAFHHSVNYRSVVVLGQGRAVLGREAKHAALRKIVEHGPTTPAGPATKSSKPPRSRR